MAVVRKAAEADLRKRYTLFIEIGLIATLVIMIAAFKLNWQSENEISFVEEQQEIVEMEEIEQTKQEAAPPPPPAPPVPIEVPNDELLEDEELDIDMELDIDETPASLPPPPPPKQEEKVEEPEPEIFMVVEEMPELIGGLASIQKDIKYPEIAKKAGVEGTVFVQFVVDEQGRVVDPVVTRGIGAGCDEAALEAVRTAKFKPGKQRGKPVKVRFSLPVKFKLK